MVDVNIILDDIFGKATADKLREATVKGKTPEEEKTLVNISLGQLCDFWNKAFDCGRKA